MFWQSWRGFGWLAAVVAIVAVIAFSSSTPASGQASPAHRFLEVNHCYRFVFPIAGSPQWKVLEILDGGWIRAEVDAGSRMGTRDAAWVNTAQLVTVRPARCAE